METEYDEQKNESMPEADEDYGAGVEMPHTQLDAYTPEQYSYLGHFANPENFNRGHNQNWIAGAIKHPGALHKQLGVPEGEKIPAKKMSAAKSGKYGKTAEKRANLAHTLGSFHK